VKHTYKDRQTYIERNLVRRYFALLVHITLTLQDILKHSERAGQDCGDLQKALRVMQVVPKAANDMMNVGRLCGFDVCNLEMFDYF